MPYRAISICMMENGVEATRTERQTLIADADATTEENQ